MRLLSVSMWTLLLLLTFININIFSICRKIKKLWYFRCVEWVSLRPLLLPTFNFYIGHLLFFSTLHKFIKRWNFAFWLIGWEYISYVKFYIQVGLLVLRFEFEFTLVHYFLAFPFPFKTWYIFFTRFTNKFFLLKYHFYLHILFVLLNV